MDILITRFVRDIAPRDYSASKLELGDNAGAITWDHACEDALELFGDAFARDAFNACFGEFGAWSDADLDAHTDAECAALMLQFIAGDLRECELIEAEPFTPEWWQEYYKLAEAGTVSGRFGEHVNGSDILYCIGS